MAQRHGRISLTHHQRANAYTLIRKIVDKFERDDAELARRVRDAKPDGYPTTSMGEGSSGGGHGDPTFRAAAQRARPQRDPAEHALDLLMEAFGIMCRADSERARALPPVTFTPNEELWCVNCSRYGIMTPRGSEKEVGKHSTLCGWCHGWRRAHDVLPPRSFVERRARGERIPLSDVERYVQALQAAKQPAKRSAS